MRSLLVAISLMLAACGHEGVSAETQQWRCERQYCAVDFLLTNDSMKRQQVAYALRAHAIKSVMPGSGGAKKQETVGELHGEVELLGKEQRQMRQLFPVSERPDLIVTTAWVLD
jgi:hypothetical protein